MELRLRGAHREIGGVLWDGWSHVAGVGITAWLHSRCDDASATIMRHIARAEILGAVGGRVSINHRGCV